MSVRYLAVLLVFSVVALAVLASCGKTLPSAPSQGQETELPATEETYPSPSPSPSPVPSPTPSPSPSPSPTSPPPVPPSLPPQPTRVREVDVDGWQDESAVAMFAGGVAHFCHDLTITRTLTSPPDDLVESVLGWPFIPPPDGYDVKAATKWAWEGKLEELPERMMADDLCSEHDVWGDTLEDVGDGSLYLLGLVKAEGDDQYWLCAAIVEKEAR